MILLEAATSRVATAAAPFGLECSPERSLKESAQQIKLLLKALDPLALPTELRDFWVWWAPELFAQPAFDGFFAPNEALDLRESMVAIGYPEHLIPVARYGKGLIWVELASAQHPGSRVYFGGYSDAELKLWTVGVSGLFELLADTIENRGVDTWSSGEHRLNPAALQSALNAHRLDFPESDIEWSVPIADRTRWPNHWTS